MKGSKTVFLVRHAQSDNNVSKLAFRSSLKRGRVPSWPEARAMAPMVSFPMDTALSDEGRRQVEAQRRNLDAVGFLESNEVQLVVHSPLRRAKATCQGLFAPHETVVEHPELYERGAWEHVRRAAIVPRIHGFVSWLLGREEQSIVVVGHSSFFTEMSGVTLDNCSVWRFSLTGDGKWEDAELLFPRPQPEL
jgi:broad specificity phosphatase PhoE